MHCEDPHHPANISGSQRTAMPPPPATAVRWRAQVLGVVLAACGGPATGVTSSMVIKTLRRAGLEAENSESMAAADYGLVPMVATGGIRFRIPSLGPDNGGRVMTFASQGDLEKMRTCYVELGEASAAFHSWVFVKDNVLVQINGSLREDKAKQCESVATPPASGPTVEASCQGEV